MTRGVRPGRRGNPCTCLDRLPRLESGRAAGGTPPAATGAAVLIGRDAELSAIADLIARARAGQAGAALLVGEPGMGKTALLDRAHHVADGFERVAVRAAPAEHALGFAGLLQVVRALPAHLDQLPSAHAAMLRGACGLGPAPPVTDRLGIHVATLLLLSAAAEARPLLLTVDDLQWLDRESLDALLFAARHLDSDAVAALFACRPGDVVTASRLPPMTLRGLAAGAAAQVVARADGTWPPRSVASALVEATGGNPLALIEVARRLSPGQLRGTEPLPPALPLTMTATQAYADVLGTLPGPVADALGLFALADGDDAGPVLAAVAELGLPCGAPARLESAGLLSYADGVIRLRHALLVAAAVDRLPPVRRRTMHRALATAMAGATSPERVVRRVRHLAEATPLPDAAVADALAAIAADRSRTSGFAAAALLYERAATLTADDLTRAGRLQAAADAASLAGYDDWSLRLLTTAHEQVSDPVFRARLDHGRGVRHIVAGRPRAAWPLLSVAADTLAPHDPHESALARADGALAAFLAGHLADARAAAAQAATAGSEVRLPAEVVGGLAALHLDDLDSALCLLTAPLGRPDLLAALLPVVEYIVPLAIGLSWIGGHDEAVRVADAAIELLREHAALGVLPAALFASAYVDTWRGRLGRAYVHAAEARALADEGTNRLWQFLIVGVLALAESLRGNVAESRRLADAVHRAHDDIDLWLPRDADDALGLAALCTGDLPAARLYLERANSPEPLGSPIFGRPTTADLVEAQVRTGHPVSDAVARRIDGPVPEGFPAVAAAVWRCRGIVGATDADMAFEAALDRYATARLPWQEARTRLTYGEALRRAGRQVDARHQLRRAADSFGTMGSPLWAERAAAELAAAGGEPRRTVAAPAETLTPQELQVALTVAGGATNREVSAALFLSPKTVEMHLTRIYRKLGLRSRSELAASFARAGARTVTRT